MQQCRPAEQMGLAGCRNNGCWLLLAACGNAYGPAAARAADKARPHSRRAAGQGPGLFYFGAPSAWFGGGCCRRRALPLEIIWR